MLFAPGSSNAHVICMQSTEIGTVAVHTAVLADGFEDPLGGVAVSAAGKGVETDRMRIF